MQFTEYNFKILSDFCENRGDKLFNRIQYLFVEMPLKQMARNGK